MPPPRRRSARVPRHAAFALLVLATACRVERGEEPDVGAPPETPPEAVQLPAETVGGAMVASLSPASGPPGESVTVHASGLPQDAAIEVGFGAPQAQFEVLGEDRSDAAGEVSATVTVPEWAEPGRGYVFTVGPVDQRPSAVSGTFHVTGPDGLVTVEGRVTDEGVECLALRSEGDELYTLQGEIEGLRAGDRVAVTGTVAEVSFCMQGITLSVERVERR